MEVLYERWCITGSQLMARDHIGQLFASVLGVERVLCVDDVNRAYFELLAETSKAHAAVAHQGLGELTLTSVRGQALRPPVTYANVVTLA